MHVRLTAHALVRACTSFVGLFWVLWRTHGHPGYAVNAHPTSYLRRWLRCTRTTHSHPIPTFQWHLGHNPARGCPPNDKGFDYFYGLPYSHEEGFPGPGPEGIIWPPVPLYENYDLIEQPINFTSLTPRYTQHVLDILDNTTKTGTPLFMYLGYEECHVPLFAARDFQNASRRGPYGDMMEQMDASIGTIMDKIRSTPALADNTIVLFTSDNGAWLAPSTGVPGAAGNPLWGGSNAPFRGGKGSTWEGGFREPAIVWAPGRVPASSVSYEPTTMMDILPTFAEYAGVQLPAGITYDGKSIVSVLNGTLAATPGAAPVHNYIWYWREKTLYAARHGQYKAHFFTRPGFGTDNATAHNPPLLFNVEHDPAEANALNASLYADELATIIAASKAHVASITPSVSEYEAQDWKLVPCCHKKFDWHQAMEFVSEGKLGLAIWDSCVCTNNTDVPVA